MVNNKSDHYVKSMYSELRYGLDNYSSVERKLEVEGKNTKNVKNVSYEMKYRLF